MNWFKKLKTEIKILVILGGFFLPMIIIVPFASIIDTNETLSTIVGLIILIIWSFDGYLTYLTIYTVHKTKKEMKLKERAEKAERMRKEEIEREIQREKARKEHDEKLIDRLLNQKNIIQDLIKKYPYTLITLTNNKREKFQENIDMLKPEYEISKSMLKEYPNLEPHYEVTFELDEIRNSVMVLSNVEIGTLPKRFNYLIETNYKAFLYKIDYDEYYRNTVSIIVFNIDDGLTTKEENNTTIRIKQIQTKNSNFPIHTKIVGVTFEGRQEYLKNSKNEDELVILHTPTPEYPNAISVFNTRTNKKLGNINSNLANVLLEEYGNNCKFNGMITNITGGGDMTYGCNILIKNIIEEV